MGTKREPSRLNEHREPSESSGPIEPSRPSGPGAKRTETHSASAKRERLDGALVIALSRSYEIAHRTSRKLVAEYGITFSQFEVLEALMHKGPLTVNAIIDAVLSTGGSITVVVRNLEKLGYVARTVNPDDGRSFIVELTACGKSLIEELFPRHMKALGASLSELGDDDIETIIELLKKVGQAQSTERKIKHDQGHKP
ncbi:MarR family winged helix-turn-helix transcriptional regulator [Raoultibacter phocaeensis]|uniref:MarR family winged helix-turn-helix transcriptional regulator n=1 Tax=Raoultibacter phocaeensis TaxID=2479841 RepID=UPI0011197A21|nr:MarR family transcriptional regulator [Raoultibacter phocaeensis]